MLVELLLYTLPVVSVAGIVVSIIYARLVKQRYDPRTCLRAMREAEERLVGEVKRLAEEASERERFWVQRVRKLCGLSEDAARILEALEKGEIQILCSDGSPAIVAAGKIICLREGRES